MKATKLFSMICVAATGIMLLGGCTKYNGYYIYHKYYSEGDYEYFKIGNDEYAVIGLTEQGKEKDTLYLPAYYKNGIVSHFGYTDGSLAANYFSVKISEATNAFFAYTFAYDYNYYTTPAANEYCTCIQTLKSVMSQSQYRDGVNYYVPFSKLEYLYGVVTNGENDCKEAEMQNAYQFSYKIRARGSSAPGINTGVVVAANTSYYFNYDESPNEDLFFINDFERGGLIEPTPYEPQRKGYRFAGWYHESECVNAWDFESDRLPAAEYDEAGNLKFIETKLYAKWKK